MRQATPHTSNTSTMEGMHTNVQEAVGDSIGRGAVYLAAAWDEYIRHEFEAHNVEDTRVDWQGTRYVLGESDYYLPDSTRRARWTMGGKYTQGKEGVATAYEWFLQLPPVVPLLVLWVVGVALLGSVALVLYWTVRVLVRLVVGSV
jgi:hypothetical protein